jgi:hypothetical protein
MGNSKRSVRCRWAKRDGGDAGIKLSVLSFSLRLSHIVHTCYFKKIHFSTPATSAYDLSPTEKRRGYISLGSFLTLQHNLFPRLQYDIPSSIYLFYLPSTALLPPSLLLRSALAAPGTVTCGLDVVSSPSLLLLLLLLLSLSATSWCGGLRLLAVLLF